jgi:tRNA U38,U39,U40 pseudouridine synthase TruA
VALRTVDSLQVHRSRGGWFVVDIRAPSFVWGMVRKIIAALRKVEDGSLSLARLEEVLAGKRRLTLPLAEPDGLVLWDVRYPVRWSLTWGGPNRAQTRYLTELVRRARLRESIGRELVRLPLPRDNGRGR